MCHGRSPPKARRSGPEPLAARASFQQAGHRCHNLRTLPEPRIGHTVRPSYMELPTSPARGFWAILPIVDVLRGHELRSSPIVRVDVGRDEPDDPSLQGGWEPCT